MILPDREIFHRFLVENEQTAPEKIALRPSPFEGLSPAFLASQIEARAKAKTKLPFLYNHPGIVYPPRLSMEQCSSQWTAAYKAALVEGLLSGADLTGGLGIDSFFLSEKCSRFDYFEKDEYLCRIAEHNFGLLCPERIAVHPGDGVESFLQSGKMCDFIYLDPSRRDAARGRVFLIEDCRPDILSIRDALLEKSPRVIVKLSPMLDIIQGIKQLEKVSEIHVVALDGEVKELLWVMEREICKNIRIIAADLFSNAPERIIRANFPVKSAVKTSSSLKKYLYDPSSCIRKAGLQDFSAQNLGLEKLHPFTHLYTSDELLENYPGRGFEIKGIASVDKKSIKELLPSRKANLAVRNFPQPVSELKKKLKITDGGEDYLFAGRLFDDSLKMILARRLF